MTTGYEAKRQAKVDRYRDLAEKNAKAAQTASTRAHEMGSVIPFGQPILVGHHSEAGHRRLLARIDNTHRKSAELDEKAAYYARKADNAESNHAISSDDPEAVTKLKEKIEKAEKKQSIFVAGNKIARSKKLTDDQKIIELQKIDGIGETAAMGLLEPDFAGRLGFPSYMMTNNNANIKRMKDRLTGLEKRSQQETTTTEVKGMTVVDNVEINRLQLIFPGKPDDETRQMLKRRGFRWSPTEGAWQRHRSNGAIYAAREIRDKLAEEVAA